MSDFSEKTSKKVQFFAHFISAISLHIWASGCTSGSYVIPLYVPFFPRFFGKKAENPRFWAIFLKNVEKNVNFCAHLGWAHLASFLKIKVVENKMKPRVYVPFFSPILWKMAQKRLFWAIWAENPQKKCNFCATLFSKMRSVYVPFFASFFQKSAELRLFSSILSKNLQKKCNFLHK